MDRFEEIGKFSPEQAMTRGPGQLIQIVLRNPVRNRGHRPSQVAGPGTSD